MLGALNHIATEHDELTVVVKGFDRYMRRNGVSDETIRDSLITVRDYIGIVLGEADTDNAVSQ